MKKIMFVCLASINLIGFSSFAHAEGIDKFYVQPGTIHVGPDNIFVEINEEFIPVSSVCVDEGGVYIPNYQSKHMTYCTRCGKNYDSDNQSSVCPHGWFAKRK